MVCFPFVVVLQSVDFVMVSRFVSHHFADVLRFSQLVFCQWLSFCCCCCFFVVLLQLILVAEYLTGCFISLCCSFLVILW